MEVSCPTCKAAKGHQMIEVVTPPSRTMPASKCFYACPASLNHLREENELLTAQNARLTEKVANLEKQLTEQARSRAAELNEANGAWKKTQQVVKYLRKLAQEEVDMPVSQPFAVEALQDAADDIEAGKDTL